MTTKEMIEVMQAYDEGKKIQSKPSGCGDWDDCYKPTWNWFEYIYRIKPESKYRPYKDTDEMVEDFKKRARLVTYDFCRPSIWIKSCDGFVSLITEFGFGCVWSSVHQVGISMKELFERYTYLDGSPCGIKEE